MVAKSLGGIVSLLHFASMASSCVPGPSSDYPDVESVHQALFTLNTSGTNDSASEEDMSSGINDGTSEEDTSGEVLSSAVSI